MKAILSSGVVWSLVAANVLFFLAVTFVSPESLLEIVISLSIAVGIGVVAAYIPGAFRALINDPRRGGQFLILGILAIWFALIGRSVWSYVYRYSGHPEWMVSDPILAYFVWLSVIGGLLHLLARGALDGNIPRSNWLYAVAVFAAGIGLFLTIRALLT